MKIERIREAMNRPVRVEEKEEEGRGIVIVIVSIFGVDWGVGG